MEPNPSVHASKAERKTIERNRRDHMRTLYSQLNSLLPHRQGSRSSRAIPLPDQLEEATKYIRELKAKLEKLKRDREKLLGTAGEVRNTCMIGSNRNMNNNDNNKRRRMRSSSSSSSGGGGGGEGYKSPKIEVHERGGAIEVILTTGLECQFIFSEAIRILHEESTEVVNAGFTVAQDTVYHTIHAKTEEEVVPSYKAAARISERLKRFACH